MSCTNGQYDKILELLLAETEITNSWELAEDEGMSEEILLKGLEFLRDQNLDLIFSKLDPKSNLYYVWIPEDRKSTANQFLEDGGWGRILINNVTSD